MSVDRYYKPGAQVKDYSIIKLLGEGRYGIVYLAYNSYHQKCVIKQLKKNMLKTTREKLFYEQELLIGLNFPCFPKFIEKFKDHNVEGYVMEYVEGKVFEDLVVREGYEFSKREIYSIAERLLNLINLLQNANIVHRDIRLPNVIQKKNGELVLIDFGLARYIDYSKYTPQMDYWYLGDFLIHLYYTSYYITSRHAKRAWYQELSLTKYEKTFLKRLLGLSIPYRSIIEIKYDLEHLKANLYF